MAAHCLYILLPLFFFFEVPLSSAKTETYEFDFPHFTYPNLDNNIAVYGDTQFSNHSWIMNINSVPFSIGSCSQIAYTGVPNLHIQDSTTGAMASFSTSFTFRFRTPTEPQPWQDTGSTDLSRVETGISLMMSRSSRFQSSMYDRTYWTSQPGACIWNPSENYNTVVFRSVYNPERNIPSNNYIGAIDGSSRDRIFKAGTTYNLCGGEARNCTGFSSGEAFTAWIDFTREKSLEVRMRNGSHLHTEKPLVPLLKVENYTLPSADGDYLSFTFLGSSGESGIFQSHEISSWRLTSEGLPLREKKKKVVGVVLGGGGAAATLLLVSYLLFRFKKERRFVSLRPLQPRAFSYKELSTATKNFTEKLGSGGYGVVYKGCFRSADGTDTLLAVKRINCELRHAEKTFLAEISSLSQIKHGNIVQLQGWCHERTRLLLVYDYMPNGSLSDWLHENRTRPPLSWTMRHRILSEVAAALEYLHKDCPQCVLHRDIKSSNIMLDNDFTAYLGDFGLARLIDHKKVDKTTLAAGTIGYIAPEVSYTGKATKESDVYSFGILLLEVVCGRTPLNVKTVDLEDDGNHEKKPAHRSTTAEAPHHLHLEDDVLLHKVWRAHETGTHLDVADHRLIRTCCRHCPLRQDGEVGTPSEGNGGDHILSIDSEAWEEIMVKNLLHLGLLCCLPSPKVRPTMERVVGFLQHIGEIMDVEYCVSKEFMPPLPSTNPMKRYSFRNLLRVEESNLQEETK